MNIFNTLSDWFFHRLLLKIEVIMSIKTDALASQLTSLSAQVDAAVSNEGALKAALNAAVADNVAKATQIAQLQADILALPAPDPTVDPALDAATAKIAELTQKLADATAANTPAN